MALTLSVIICSYTLDRWSDIERAVASVAGESPQPAEVLLVSDYSAELAERARAAFPQVRVLDNDERQGLSGARNTGVRAATGDIVAFLDDDAAVEPGWVAAMLAPYASPDVVGVAGQVNPDWRSPRPGWFPGEFLWVLGCSYTGQPTAAGVEVRNAIGANMSFRRSALLTVSGFDSAIGRLGKDAAGCEETELSIRVRRELGGRIVTAPAAAVRHSVTTERTTRAYFRRRCLGEGRSKALVSTMIGNDAALSAERSYATKVLPSAVLRGLIAGMTGDRAGFARAWAVLEGLAFTTGGFLQRRLKPARPQS